MAEISSINSQILELPPSCIKFSPSYPDYFVIGTYHLEKQEAENPVTEENGDEVDVKDEKVAQQRNGSVILFKLENDKLCLIQTFPTDFAILDLHFDPHRSSDASEDLLATANSTGSLAIYQLVSKPNEPLKIEQKSLSQVWDKTILALSFSFHPSDKSVLGVTLSTGEVALCRIDPDSFEVNSFVTVVTHSLEAWTLCFSTGSNDLLSGGDDALIQKILLSEFTSVDEFEPPPVVWKNRKIHSAGVTAILFLTKGVYLTGSYDDYARIIVDVANRPVCLAESNLGGGVWRLKAISYRAPEHGQHNNTQFDVLASCMHAGARILRIDLAPSPRITVLAKFEEHQSMNYGSDLQPTGEGGVYTIVSTSFYDKRLCLWKAQPPSPMVPYSSFQHQEHEAQGQETETQIE
jgi:diphthamide biosynthesis protein 7